MIGIDPGVSGALAFLSGANAAVLDMPNADGQVLADPLYGILADWHAETVYIEKAQSMPGQGVSSTFKYGVGYGVILGVCAARGIAVVEVSPAKWKKAMGLTGKDKEASRALACKLFPSVASKMMRKKDHGRAEALLIAEYARRTFHAGA